jgi:uncharacterized phage-associated protein
MNSLLIAHYILYKYADQPVTHLKLQKLLYYLKVWGLVAGTDLVSGNFEKWKYGPVNREVYQVYKQYGHHPIPAPVQVTQPTHKDKDLVDFILEAYINFSASTLSAMTHSDFPWQETPDDTAIPNDVIKKYYETQSFARNFNPFDPTHKPFYPVQSNTWYAFTLDMAEDDKERSAQYASYQNYQTQIQQARQQAQELVQLLGQPNGHDEF